MVLDSLDLGHEAALLGADLVVGDIADQDLVTSLAAGNTLADVASAACHSVAEQIYEQQLQEIEVRQPIIQVGGTSLISGLVTAMEHTLGHRPIVPKDSQYIGAVGGALLVSGLLG